MNIILKCRDLKKEYVTGDIRYLAVKGIDLDIEAGKFYAVIGKSGSGKSTLLHLLSGLDKPTEGHVWINGHDINRLKDSERSKLRRQRIGFVFQAYNLLPELCVEENIKLPLYLDGKRQKRKYVSDLMKKLELYDLRLKFPSQLSGGEQQRVAIARALIMKPDIIFADEPTGNLDQKTGETILGVFRFMREEFGQTILLVTHDMDVAKQADEMIEMRDGEIIQV